MCYAHTELRVQVLTARTRIQNESEAGMADVLTAFLIAAALPLPVPDYRFAPPRRWRFDYAWPALRLALEIEGGIWTDGRHVRGRGYERDCEKYNAAALAGWRVLRVTPRMMRDGRALQLLTAVLAAALDDSVE